MKSLTALTIAALALALTSCATQAEPEDRVGLPPATSEAPPAGEELGSDAGFGPIDAQPVPAEGPGFDEPADFDTTVTFPHGLEATVHDVVMRRGTEEDAIAEPGYGILEYQVTFNNQTGERLDGLTADVDTGANSDGEHYLWDSPGVETLFDGEEATGQYAAMVPFDTAKERVRITVTDPLGTTAGAIWQGTATP